MAQPQQPPPQQPPQQGKPPPDGAPPPDPDDGPDPPPPHDCSDCEIVQVQPAPPFPGGRRTSLRAQYGVAANPRIVFTAVASDPACPCEWNNRFQIAGHRIATGHTMLTRETLNAGLSPLIETLTPRLDQLQPFFTVAGCTLTIEVEALDQSLRQGIGLANNVVMIEMGLQVRCSPKGRWRNIRVVFTD